MLPLMDVEPVCITYFIFLLTLKGKPDSGDFNPTAAPSSLQLKSVG